MKILNRLEPISFYILIGTMILSSLVFVPTQFFSFDLTKSVIISIGVLIAFVLYITLFVKEGRLILPQKSLTIVSLLIVLSLVISSLTSVHISKSLIGQGFENGTTSFIAILFLSALLAFMVVEKRAERSIVLYSGMIIVYIILSLFHLIRVITGPEFANFSILNSTTSSIFGSWSSFGAFSMLITLLALSAIIFLLSSVRLKVFYWIIVALSLAFVLIINVKWILISGFICLVGLTIFLTYTKISSGNSVMLFIRRIAWAPLILAIILGLFIWRGEPVVSKINSSLGTSYIELALPWQMTLDVGSEIIKNDPLLGIGPNHFGRAFLSFKPALINTTDLWGVEFNSGFGTLPTLFLAQGLIGIILWLVFLTLLGIIGARVLKKMPNDPPYSRFILASSYIISIFSWITLLGYSPSHTFLFIAFISTGIFVGAAANYGLINKYRLEPPSSKIFSLVGITIAIVGIIWIGIYINKTTAFAYFSSGIKQISTSGNALEADKNFSKAYAIDSSDIYLQARVEVALSRIRQIVNKNQGNQITEEESNEIVSLIEDGIKYAKEAIAYDQNNYYNHLSHGKISEMAMNFQAPEAYEATVRSYTNAITINPYNPSLYLNIARVHASKGNYDQALQAVGGALQVKRNYSEAAFLASQISAAQGNIADAITAADFTAQLSPNSPLAFFQIGVLQYTARNYSAATIALARAVELQPDYANAKYFLGLSYARLGKTNEAIDQFEKLSETNPENTEVTAILDALYSGKSIFVNPQPPITPNPEKRSSLPFKDGE